MTETECPFCEIIDRDDPDAREVYRDEHVVAFFPTEPAVLGHLLVVPRRHVKDIWSLKPQEAADLSRAVLYLAKAVRDALLPEGLNVIQSNGSAATQTVAHLHVHLVPRRNGDAMGPIWPEETDYLESSKDEVLGRIREALRRQGASVQPPLSAEDRRKHLDYIQAVVTRQSAASSAAKGWLLPIVTATYGFALTQHAWSLAALGLVSVILFAYLDANYLRSEKRFRELYNTVARAKRMVPHFTLDPTDADDPVPNEAPAVSKLRSFVSTYLPDKAVWISWSIAPFYLALLLVGVGVLVIAV